MNEQEKKQIEYLQEEIEDIKAGKLTDWVFLGTGQDSGLREIVSSRPTILATTLMALEADLLDKED